MLVNPRDIIHQKQPCGKSCVLTCIAMAIGMDVKKVLSHVLQLGFDVAMSDPEVYGYLVNNNVLPVRIDAPIMTQLPPGRILFGNEISMNGNLHAVILTICPETGTVRIFDPKCDSVRIVTCEHEMPAFIRIEALYDCTGYKAS